MLQNHFIKYLLLMISWLLGWLHAIIWNNLEEPRGPTVAIPTKIYLLIGNHLLNSLLTLLCRHATSASNEKVQGILDTSEFQIIFWCLFKSSYKALWSFSTIENCTQAPKGQAFPNLSLMALLCELRSFIKITEAQIHLLPCIETSQRDN